MDGTGECEFNWNKRVTEIKVPYILSSMQKTERGLHDCELLIAVGKSIGWVKGFDQLCCMQLQKHNTEPCSYIHLMNVRQRLWKRSRSCACWPMVGGESLQKEKEEGLNALWSLCLRLEEFCLGCHHLPGFGECRRWQALTRLFLLDHHSKDRKDFRFLKDCL